MNEICSNNLGQISHLQDTNTYTNCIQTLGNVFYTKNLKISYPLTHDYFDDE